MVKHGSIFLNMSVNDVRTMVLMISVRPSYQVERWNTIFPAYLNKKKTVAEGRRIPKDKAVENPNFSEIAEVMKAKGFQVACPWMTV